MAADRVFHALRSLGGRLKFFNEGWGCALAESGHREWLRAVARRCAPVPAPLDLRFTPHPLGRVAEFDSPARAYLPPESSRARAWFVDPVPRRSPRPPPCVVQLSATGDHGYLTRYLFFARRLARIGIASVLLENPMYGKRAPAGQKGAKLKTVGHLADMGRATVEECVGLLYYLFEQGHRRLCAFGLSQGGLHAAMATSVCPFPVHCVSAIAPASAAPVFTRGCLSSAVNWSALSSEGETVARQALAAHLDSVASIALFPEPPVRARHILLQAQDDEYVQVEYLKAWRSARPDVEVRMLPGGHVSAVLLRSNSILDAVERVMLREASSPTSPSSDDETSSQGDCSSVNSRGPDLC